MSARKTIEYVPDPNKFDLVVHRWDTQGRLTGKPNHYRKYIVGGAEYYERPVNSGNLWHPNNQPAGRVLCQFDDNGKIIKKDFDFAAEHIHYVPPLTGDAKIAAELASSKAEIEALRKELSSLGKERAAKPVDKPKEK